MNRAHFSLILRIAGKGFQLAKYLSRSKVGMNNGMVRSLANEIIDLQQKAADSVQRAPHTPTPLFDVEIEARKDGSVGVTKGFDLL